MSSRDEDDAFGLPPDDLDAFLDRLEAEPGESLPDASSSSSPHFDREEIDELVNLVIDEELARLKEKPSPPEPSPGEEGEGKT